MRGYSSVFPIKKIFLSPFGMESTWIGLSGPLFEFLIFFLFTILYAGILQQSMGARNRVGIGLSYRPAFNIGWRNRFLVIDSWAP